MVIVIADTAEMTGTGPSTSDRGAVEAATGDLLLWVSETAGQQVRLGTPGDDGALSLWPLELRPQRQIRSAAAAREPFRFTVRHLLAAGGAGSLPQLDRILAAAVAAGEPDVLLEAGDPQLWRAFGVPPRPALLLDVPAQIAFAVPSAPPVRHPLRIQHVARRTLAGQVVGPGDVPLAAMRVEVAGTSHTTHTDAQGRFSVPGVPDTGEARLRLVGRGHVLTVVVDPAEADLVVHCDLPTA